MSDSIWNDPRITAYALDELTGDERSEFEREMSSNPQLTAAVQEARQITDALSDEWSREPSAGLSAEAQSVLFSRINGERCAEEATAAEKRSTRLVEQADGGSASRFGARFLSLAASLLVLGGITTALVIAPRQQLARVGMQTERLAEEDPLAASRGAQQEPALRTSDESGEALSGASAFDRTYSTRLNMAPNAPNSSDADFPGEGTPVGQVAGEPDPSVGDESGRRLSESLAARPEPSNATRYSLAAPADAVRRGSTRSGPPAPAEDFARPEVKLSVEQPASNGVVDGRAGQRGGEVTNLYAGDAGYGHEAGYGSGYSVEADPRGGYGGYGGYGGEADMAEGYGEGYGGGYGSPRDEVLRSVRATEPGQEQIVAGAPVLLRQERSVPALRVEGEELSDRGRGPGQAGDRYEPITDNPFRRTSEHPFSTFSIDVDTASFAKVRQYLLEAGSLPRPDAVRIEELVNYFDYDYQAPADDAEHPFAAHMEVAACPWQPSHRLARVAIKGKEMRNDERPASNLVFLLDVSGSMDQPNKLPLVKRGMQMLMEQLGENDRVSIVVYAGAAGLVLPTTTADRRQEINTALDRLKAGGSTNGGDGIQLAYATARDAFIPGGTNRVILCTDGDFNVGTTGTDQLVRMVESEATGGVYLTVLGFGMGNHNDAMLEEISGRGNGNYAFIDTEKEARKVLVQQISGTLVTIANDVKIQVEFNPTRVAAYRLIGYENRILAKEDFNDDKKDAGEIGAGHAVTALYELVPVDAESPQPQRPEVDELRYQTAAQPTERAMSDELLTLKLRYKQPGESTSTLVEFPVEDDDRSFAAADKDFQFAAAVAGFGMLLRDSPHRGNWTYAAAREVAGDSMGEDRHGFRAELLRMIDRAAALSGR